MAVDDRKPFRLISGNICPLSQAKNKGSLDWGWQNLIAYGSKKSVIIVDPGDIHIIQKLNLHSFPVTKVKWSCENYHHDVGSPYALRLVSADTNGVLISWDVGEGNAVAKFSEGNRLVEDLQWLNCQDASHDLLLVLHSPNMFILWNADTGTPLWRKVYSVAPQLFKFSFDPFDQHKLAVSGKGLLLFINDFKINNEPKSDGKLFYPVVQTDAKKNSSRFPNFKNNSRLKLLAEEDFKRAPKQTVSSCIDIHYAPSARHHLLLLLPQEIVVLDTESMQIVNSVPTDRGSSLYNQVFPCLHRFAIYSVHENGVISLHLQKPRVLKDEPTDDATYSNPVSYYEACHSEPLRISNKAQLFGAAVCPVSEMQVALLQSNGQLLLWKVTGTRADEESKHETFRPAQAREVEPFNELLSGTIAPSVSLASEEDRELPDMNLRINLQFTLTGLLSTSVYSPTCIKSCPPLTHRNWSYYRPLLAIGNSQGSIFIYDLGSGRVFRSYSLHTVEVRGIEWLSCTSIITYGYSSSAASLHAASSHAAREIVHNEIFVIDVESGQSRSLRQDRKDYTPVLFIKVSHHRQYMVIAFKEKGVEIWDIKSMRIMREISKEFSNIIAMEWAPFHKKGGSSDQSAGDAATSFKEHLVFSDRIGSVHHCIAEGSSFRQGSTIPFAYDGSSGSGGPIINSISWKSDILFMGRLDGHVTVWDLKAKVSRTVSSHHSIIRKVKFGPGKGNLKVLILFSNTIEIWDAQAFMCVCRTFVKENCQIRDAEWCASDKIVVMLEDGEIHVADALAPKLTQNQSILLDGDESSASVAVLPRLLTAKDSFQLKFKLCNSPLEEAEVTQRGGISSSLLKSLSSEDTLQRCVAVSRLFGDESDFRFWNAVSHAVSHTLMARGDSGSQSSKSDLTATCCDLPCDVMCNNTLFKRVERERALCHYMLRETMTHDNHCVEKFIYLQQIDRAIQVLLETSPEHESYYENSLKACLLATLKEDSSPAALSTIKLIATSLIASGKYKEGAELLCVIDKVVDACRYLTTSDCWDDAVWLAKVRLDQAAFTDTMKQWANHLCSSKVNRKSTALLVYLSLGQFATTMSKLHDMRHFDRSGLLARICKEKGILKEDEDTGLFEKDYQKFMESV